MIETVKVFMFVCAYFAFYFVVTKHVMKRIDADFEKEQ